MPNLSIDVSGLLRKPGSRETLIIHETLPPIEKGHEKIRVKGLAGISLILREAGGKILAEGKLEANVELVCGRCLKAFDSRVEQSFIELFRKRGDFNREDPNEREDETFLAIQNNRIDLAPVLSQALVIAVPYKPLCDENCRGLCPVCGGDLNDGTHDHVVKEEEMTGYRAKLKRFKEQHP